jgi:uncharacterized protein (UPF0548 family)
VTFTYPETGGTRGGDLPAGYRHVRRDAVIGHGEAAFSAVREGMRRWQIHRLSGMRVSNAPEPAVGARFVAVLGFLRIPCQVVWVRDEPSTYGYGFGTLPGHPARGEEAFEVTLSDDGDVRFAVRAFSRHAAWYARLGGPFTTLMQERMTDRYVRSARRLAQPDH